MNTRIVCAACRYLNVTICGIRHFDPIMNSQIRAMRKTALPVSSSQWEQGFLDNRRQFHTRREAMIVAKASGQKLSLRRNGDPNETKLYSEGIY